MTLGTRGSSLPSQLPASPLTRSKARSTGSAGMAGVGGMMGGMGGYGRAAATPASVAQGPSRAESVQSLEGKVRQIGAKTFYWKNKRWVDSSVKPEEDAKATVVTQLTDAVLSARPHAESRVQPVPEPDRARHRKARRQGISRRPGTAGDGTMNSRGWSSRHPSPVVRTNPPHSQHLMRPTATPAMIPPMLIRCPN